MPPLTRQLTPQSLYSEWSRSYLGATISIHALAKPLMKLMYHRAGSNLIKGQGRIPLSAETMEIYRSYLESKYVAVTTKALILEEIYKRAILASEAQAAAGLLVSYDLLLDSTDVEVRFWTSYILGELASQSSTRRTVAAVQPCARLVALLSDGSLYGYVQGACSALAQISRDLDGARAVVEAGALETIESLLQSPQAKVRKSISQMLGALGMHPSTRVAVVSVQPCAHLVALLGDDNGEVVEGACYALSQISHDLNGARAVVNAGALETVERLLKSPAAGVRRWASQILARLAFHPSTRGAVVAAQPCAQLVVLLGSIQSHPPVLLVWSQTAGLSLSKEEMPLRTMY